MLNLIEIGDRVRIVNEEDPHHGRIGEVSETKQQYLVYFSQHPDDYSIFYRADLEKENKNMTAKKNDTTEDAIKVWLMSGIPFGTVNTLKGGK